MFHFAEINQILSSYSMLQDTGRVATLKLVPRNSQILANNIDCGGRGTGLRIYVRYCGFPGVKSTSRCCW